MCWICLFLAIFLEVAATIFMKLSNGFTRVVPTVAMFVLYGLSFWPMAIVLKHMEIGAVYAIWSAVGTAAVAVLGILVFHEPASALKAVAIALIIAGVVCLNLSTPDPDTQAQLRSDLRLENPRQTKTGNVVAPRLLSKTVTPITGP